MPLKAAEEANVPTTLAALLYSFVEGRTFDD